MPYIERLDQISKRLFFIHWNFHRYKFWWNYHYIHLGKSIFIIPLTHTTPFSLIMSLSVSRFMVNPFLLSKLHVIRFFLVSDTCFTFYRVTSSPYVILKITLLQLSVLETVLFPMNNYSLSFAHLICSEHWPICVNVCGGSCIIPPLLRVVHSHVDLSHHCAKFLFKEIDLIHLIFDLTACGTHHSCVWFLLKYSHFPWNFPHLIQRLSFQVYFQKFSREHPFWKVSRRVYFCISFCLSTQ